MSLELLRDGTDHELLRNLLDLPSQGAGRRARATACAEAVCHPRQEGKHDPG